MAYISKVQTIGKYGLLFCDDAGFKDRYWNFGPTVYAGEIGSIPDDVATDIAEIHEQYEDYYKHCMVPLFKGYTGPVKRSGTESPQMAILSKMKEKEKSVCTQVIIWKIM